MDERKVGMEDILTTGRIAKFCQVDSRTVNRWIEEGLLKAHQIPLSGFNRVKVCDFINFLKDQAMPIPAELKSLDQIKILVVDDEPFMIKTIERTLRGLENVTIVMESAQDGFEAGRILERFRPDLMIVDLLMPKMNGLEVCKSIRKNPETRKIKILVLSGSASDEKKHEALHAGASDYLTKPFRPQELRECVSNLLEAKE